MAFKTWRIHILNDFENGVSEVVKGLKIREQDPSWNAGLGEKIFCLSADWSSLTIADDCQSLWQDN